MAEPKSAADYDDRTTQAVKSVLIEIGQLLGSYHGKYAIIGGVVPTLLLADAEMPHVGTVDVDLSLHAEALGDGEYAHLVKEMMEHGYKQTAALKRFQLQREVPVEGEDPILIVVDFLMPRDAKIEKNKPPIIEDFAVQRAHGADLALEFNNLLELSGKMPDGRPNRVSIPVCSIPALLAMKGYALVGRSKEKDAYDIYYCVRNYPGGIAELAKDCRALMQHKSAIAGYTNIAGKFDAVESYGPATVRKFVAETRLLGDRTAEQWQVDAHGQVSAWLRAIGM